MAKIRVYELARELNLQNKQLLEKLSEMNLEVGSHMSSLDDEAVAVIKSNLLGKAEESKVVEETRIKPTVIRRRRKAVAEPEVQAEPVETEASAPASEADAVAVEETDTPEATIEVAEEAPAPKRRSKAKTKAEAAAKVIAPAPVETPEPEPEAEAAPEAAPEPEVAPEPEPTPEPETSETAADAAPPAEATEPPAAEAPAATVKRGKVDTPARIIKRAPVVPPKPRQPERTRRTPPAAQAAKPAPTGARPERDDRKKKGRRGRTDGNFGDYPGPKKKISFRRKEVIEGSALYSRGGRKGRKGGKSKITTGQKTQITTAKAIKRRVKIDDTIALSELAKRMGIKASDMIRKLMGMGVMATVNQTIDYETATLVAAEFDYEVERASFEEEAIIRVSEDAPDQLAGRPPVVTIMGHVDHGKTSLLDVIRESSVTDTEAGGITQHIGAYTVSTDKGNITFLDTPGHEAFSAMRSRGAQVTDIVILVVAADDGVMPQTIEAINHAKAAEVPIIVAVNKIDKAGAEPDRVQRELAEAGLAPEDWGGDTIFMQVSAKTKSGISELLEMILLQSEMLELKANPDKLALGHVIEAKLDSGRGPVATVLVTDGTLKVGQPVVCGIHYGKLRAVSDDRGNPVTEAGPATPVEIIGLSGVPNAGDEMVALADEKDAKQVSQHRSMKQRSLDLAKTSRLSLENLFEHMKEGDIKDLNVVVKADVQGSIEAISDALAKLNNEEVKINVVHAATGTISESDVFLATGSNAIIIGFNVRPNAKVQALAQEEHVDMRFYNIIYNLIKDVQDAMVGMMASQFEERILGRAEVRQVFHIPKIGAIAGSYVTDGSFKRGQMLRLLRDGIIIYEGKNSSLRRFKDDVKEVQAGYECGIGIENFNDIKEGDTIECFYLEEIKPKIA